jgi:hypothetical protein
MRSNPAATFFLGALIGIVAGGAFIYHTAYQAGHDQAVKDLVKQGLDKIPFPKK